MGAPKEPESDVESNDDEGLPATLTDKQKAALKKKLEIADNQKAKILETEDEKASRKEKVGEDTELGLDTCRYNQQINASRIHFYNHHPTIDPNNIDELISKADTDITAQGTEQVLFYDRAEKASFDFKPRGLGFDLRTVSTYQKRTPVAAKPTVAPAHHGSNAPPKAGAKQGKTKKRRRTRSKNKRKNKSVLPVATQIGSGQTAKKKRNAKTGKFVLAGAQPSASTTMASILGIQQQPSSAGQQASTSFANPSSIAAPLVAVVPLASASTSNTQPKKKARKPRNRNNKAKTNTQPSAGTTMAASLATQQQSKSAGQQACVLPSTSYKLPSNAVGGNSAFNPSVTAASSINALFGTQQQPNPNGHQLLVFGASQQLDSAGHQPSTNFADPLSYFGPPPTAAAIFRANHPETLLLQELQSDSQELSRSLANDISSAHGKAPMEGGSGAGQSVFRILAGNQPSSTTMASSLSNQKQPSSAGQQPSTSVANPSSQSAHGNVSSVPLEGGSAAGPPVSPITPTPMKNSRKMKDKSLAASGSEQNSMEENTGGNTPGTPGPPPQKKLCGGDN